MKKIALLLSLIMVLCTVQYASAADPVGYEDTSYFYGDADLNGTVDAKDALLVLQHAAKLTTIADELSLTLADIVTDGTINGTDALEILKTAAKLTELRETKHSGQYICTKCNTSFFEMTKEILIKKGGSYKNNNSKISYNSSENRIEIAYTYSANNNDDKYTFLVYMMNNRPSLTWEYTHEQKNYDYRNGYLVFKGTTEKYMRGEIACSSITPSTSKLEYTYNTFSTQYTQRKTPSGYIFTSDAEIAKSNAAVDLKHSIDALEGLIEKYGNGKFELYNLGFSTYY